MKNYKLRVIDTIVTEYTCRASSKRKAEQKYLIGKTEETERGELTDRVIEVEEIQ